MREEPSGDRHPEVLPSIGGAQGRHPDDPQVAEVGLEDPEGRKRLPLQAQNEKVVDLVLRESGRDRVDNEPEGGRRVSRSEGTREGAAETGEEVESLAPLQQDIDSRQQGLPESEGQEADDLGS